MSGKLSADWGAANKTERWVWSLRRGILEGIPPCTDLAENFAGNLVPVDLGVLSAGNVGAAGVTADGLTSLGDPDGLALGGGSGVAVCLVEEVGGVVDTVGVVGLEIGVHVNTEEVGAVNNSAVAAVDPDRGIS